MGRSEKRNLTIWLWLIFGFSIVVRFYLALKTGVISISLDEPWYWSISRALLHGKAQIFRGTEQPVKDILYPLLLTPAHMLQGFDLVHHTMLLINVLVMSSAVFPAFLLAKAVLNDRRKALLIAIISLILPEMFYSAKLLQECMYYPYVLWMLWLFFVFLLKNKYNPIRVAVFSALLCFAGYIKGIGSCLILAFFLFYVIQLVFCGTIKQKVKSAFVLAESVAVCMAVDHLIVVYIEKLDSLSLDKLVIAYLNGVTYKLFGYTNYSLLQLTAFFLAGVAVLLLLATALRYCGKKLLRYRWSPAVFCAGAVLLLAGAGAALYRLGYLRPFTTYVIFSCIFWGIFPILLPVIYVRELSEKERDLLLFLVVSWLVPLAASCFSTLNIWTEAGPGGIRFHYRYFYYPIVGFFVLFLAVRKRIQTKEKTVLTAVWILVCILAVALVTPAKPGSMVDAVPIYGMMGFLNSRRGVLLLRALLILYLLWGAWVLRKKHVKGFYVGVLLLTCCFYLAGTRVVYQSCAGRKQELAGKNRDGERLEKYFADKGIGEDANRILVVGDAILNSTETTEVHLTVPYRFCLWQNLTAPEVLVDGQLQGGLLDLYVEWAYRLEGYSPQYIVSLYPIRLTGYNAEQLGLENFYLYVRADG